MSIAKEMEMEMEMESGRDRAGPGRAVSSEPHIVMQYWRGDVRVCELESGGDTLDIHISRAGVEDQGDWVVALYSGRADSALSVTERGATPAAALLAATKAWALQGPALSLRAWDWDAVMRVLKAVHAIE